MCGCIHSKWTFDKNNNNNVDDGDECMALTTWLMSLTMSFSIEFLASMKVILVFYSSFTVKSCQYVYIIKVNILSEPEIE